MKTIDERLKQIIRPYLMGETNEFDTLINLKMYIARVFFWSFVAGSVLSVIICTVWK